MLVASLNDSKLFAESSSKSDLSLSSNSAEVKHKLVVLLDAVELTVDVKLLIINNRIEIIN